MEINKQNLKIYYVPLASLRHPEINPRVWSKEATKQLRESITAFGIIDPLIVNNAPKRDGIIVGGNFRATVLKEMGIETVPVVYVTITDKKKESELIIRLNKNTGEFDLDLLAKFDQSFLADIGFSSEEIDDIFPTEDIAETFDLEHELKKLKIDKIEIQKGDVWQIGDNIRIGCGDSTIPSQKALPCHKEIFHRYGIVVFMSEHNKTMSVPPPCKRRSYLSAPRSLTKFGTRI